MSGDGGFQADFDFVGNIGEFDQLHAEAIELLRGARVFFLYALTPGAVPRALFAIPESLSGLVLENIEEMVDHVKDSS